eukprot:scaffold89555_cov26-Tisochrysis_lutea.AAC.3
MQGYSHDYPAALPTSMHTSRSARVLCMNCKAVECHWLPYIQLACEQLGSQCCLNAQRWTQRKQLHHSLHHDELGRVVRNANQAPLAMAGGTHHRDACFWRAAS